MAINWVKVLKKIFSSDILAQLMGNGIPTIDKKTKLNHFFNNDEVIFYNSIKDLSKKIIFYSKTIRKEKISKKGS